MHKVHFSLHFSKKQPVAFKGMGLWRSEDSEANIESALAMHRFILTFFFIKVLCDFAEILGNGVKPK